MTCLGDLGGGEGWQRGSMEMQELGVVLMRRRARNGGVEEVNDQTMTVRRADLRLA